MEAPTIKFNRTESGGVDILCENFNGLFDGTADLLDRNYVPFNRDEWITNLQNELEVIQEKAAEKHGLSEPVLSGIITFISIVKVVTARKAQGFNDLSVSTLN